MSYIYKSRHWQEDSISSTSLDDNSLALHMLAEVNNALIVDLGLKVQHLDHVANHPRQLLVLLDLGEVIGEILGGPVKVVVKPFGLSLELLDVVVEYFDSGPNFVINEIPYLVESLLDLHSVDSPSHCLKIFQIV